LKYVCRSWYDICKRIYFKRGTRYLLIEKKENSYIPLIIRSFDPPIIHKFNMKFEKNTIFICFDKKEIELKKLKTLESFQLISTKTPSSLFGKNYCDRCRLLTYCITKSYWFNSEYECQTINCYTRNRFLQENSYIISGITIYGNQRYEYHIHK
ncbi:5181_t:CDS:1, partial [Cetraspora pellucida]